MAETRWIPSQRSGRAALLGQGLGAGLSSGVEDILSQLAQKKAEDLRAKDLKRFLPNVSMEDVQALSRLGSAQYEPVLRAYGQVNQSQNAPEQLAQAKGPQMNDLKPIDFLKSFSSLGYNIPPELEKRLSALPEKQIAPIAQKAFESLNDQQKQRLMQDLIAKQQLPQQQPQNQQPFQQQMPLEQQQMQPQGFPSPVQAATHNYPFGSPFNTPTSSTRAAELEFRKQQAAEKKEREERKFETGQESEAREFNKDYIKKLQDSAEASRRNINSYNQLIRLAQKGDIRSGNAHQLLEKFGLEDFAQGVDTQLTKKTAARLAQGASSAFNTSRLTNLDVGLYTDSLITLKNTPEGIIAIAETQKKEEEANVLKNEIRKDIMLENNGKVPFDLRDQVEDRAQPELQRLAQESIALIDKAIADQQEYKVFNGVELPADSSKLPPETVYTYGGVDYAPDGQGGWRIL